jgi:hypothetical protein
VEELWSARVPNGQIEARIAEQFGVSSRMVRNDIRRVRQKAVRLWSKSLPFLQAQWLRNLIRRADQAFAAEEWDAGTKLEAMIGQAIGALVPKQWGANARREDDPANSQRSANLMNLMKDFQGGERIKAADVVPPANGTNGNGKH